MFFVCGAVYRRGRVGIDSDDRMQFRFGTGFQSQVEFLAMADDLFYHGTYLVDLNGINDEILSFVVIFLGSLLEAIAGFLDTVVQNVGNPYQYGSRQVPNGQFVHQFP